MLADTHRSSSPQDYPVWRERRGGVGWGWWEVRSQLVIQTWLLTSLNRASAIRNVFFEVESESCRDQVMIA